VLTEDEEMNKKLALLIMVGLFIAVAGGLLLQQKAGTIDNSYVTFPAPAPVLKETAEMREKKGFGLPSFSIGSEAKETQTSYVVDRQVIKTAYLSIEVDDFQEAAKDVEGITAKAGGYVLSSNSYVTDTGHRRGSVTIRVPETGFLSVIEELEAIGEVKSKSATGQDVTEEYIDLEARLKNYEKQEARLLEILSKAEKVEDILKVEEQLGRVRGEIERLTGRLRYLNERIEMATITVELYEPEPITQSWGLRNALKLAVAGFITTVNAIIVFIGYALPLAAIGVAVLFLYRRRKIKAMEEPKKG
jgi:uncharacterized protein YxeA